MWPYESITGIGWCIISITSRMTVIFLFEKLVSAKIQWSWNPHSGLTCLIELAIDHRATCQRHMLRCVEDALRPAWPHWYVPSILTIRWWWPSGIRDERRSSPCSPEYPSFANKLLKNPKFLDRSHLPVLNKGASRFFNFDDKMRTLQTSMIMNIVWVPDSTDTA